METAGNGKRLINWWLRWDDLNWPNQDVHDRIKRRAENAAQANVTTAILFGAHFRWDYLPYFTILHDHIATVAEELHQYGLELYDRHSVNLIHRYDTKEQMRHVMLHSGPHLPFSPSREAAADWSYRGKKLNDWRMIDVKTGDVLYYPQYAGEGFCYRNPDFIEAYCDYAKRLIEDTGIDGLAAEDPVHYMRFNSCGCPHCRAELKRRSGIDLPPIEDRGFWGNWENPAWKDWIDMRFDSGKEFFEKLIPCLPKDFPVTTCGANSASAETISLASDARAFIEGGSNYVHSELSGNTPPYLKDPVTVNVTIPSRMVAFSHHQAVARESGIRSFSTGYGFTKPSANIIWAVNKVLDNDCCFSTLKARLGLPDHILHTLPEESDVIGDAYTFEKDHPNLFNGKQLGQLGVFFSYETRNHTCFGALTKGYALDYATTLNTLFRAGLSPHTVFSFPENADEYPLIVLPSVAAMTENEAAAMKKYTAQGGTVIITGPCPLPQCKDHWKLPTQPAIDEPNAFFSTIANGVWIKIADWVKNTTLAPCDLAGDWQPLAKGIYYNPHRISDGLIENSFLELCKQHAKPMPVTILSAEGYLVTAFASGNKTIVHLLASEYDTDIDHTLDEMRFHRSRVNYVNKVTPLGVDHPIRLQFDGAVTVHTPFSTEPSSTAQDKDVWQISLPKETAYAILELTP